MLFSIAGYCKRTEAKNARRALQINFSSFPEVKCSVLRTILTDTNFLIFSVTWVKFVVKRETSCEENTNSDSHESLV